MPLTGARPRTAPLVLGVVLVLLLGVLAVPVPAGAASGPAGTLLARLNDARTSRGLATLAPTEDLAAVATRHSRRMAASGDLRHNPSLGSEVESWRVVAENVGRGRDADQLHRMFMESSTHVANILDERVTQVGVGVVDVDGQLWVTQVFRQPLETSTSAPSRSSTAPPPDPAPAPPADATPVPAPGPPAPVIGVAAATATRVAPAPAAIGVAAATPTTTAPGPAGDPGGAGGFLAAAARWVASLL